MQQVFLIAKIGQGKKRRYRCVAAFHWQWLYGQGPARAAYRFINALKNPLNGRLVQADLKTFDNYEAKLEEWDRAVPCPYITMLYQKSTCIGVDDEYIGRCYVESADMQSGGGDNNDGITIIDITDISRPRCCMVFLWDRQDDEGTVTMKGYQPISPKQYVQVYYPHLEPKPDSPVPDSINKEEQYMRTAYERLSDIPLIDIDTLAEAWPAEYGRGDTKQDGIVNPTRTPSKDTEAEGHEDVPMVSSEPQDVPSLAAFAMLKALQSLLQDGGDTEQVQSLLQMPMNSEMMITTMNHLALQSALPDSIIPVLGSFLMSTSRESFLDISPFPLSDGQLVALMKLVPACKILKLGGRVDVKVEELSEAIRLVPSIEAVILFDHRITLAQLEQLRSDLSCHASVFHKGEYFKYADTSGYQYTNNAPEFIFMTRKRPSMYRSRWEPITEGTGIENIEDPNFIIQAIRDSIHVLSGDYMERTCFTVNARAYGTPFACSSFITYGSPAPTIERSRDDKVQWIFFLNTESHSGLPLLGSYWIYGFIRRQHGFPLQVMDLDGFIAALSKERLDLPSIQGSDQAIVVEKGASFKSFLDELRYLLGAKLGEDTSRDKPGRTPCKLLTVREAETVISEL